MQKFFITTSIAYANAAPHIGHAYEIVLTDIIARYKRMRGLETFFLTGTDEHGDKILRAAKDARKAPQVFVDENAKKFENLYESLAISYDYFIRTSDKKNHWPGAQALWQKLLVSNDLYKGVYKGLYCVGCEAFITEKELVDGKCPNHNTVPETIEEENYFFRLSKYGPAIQKAIESRELNIIPESRAHEVLSMMKEDIHDISFSRPERDVLWGIPVPNDQKQMMYVWCDALSNYISALGYGRTDNENFKRFWPADMHMIGKDILRFHAIIWPAILLSAGVPLPRQIFVHGFITSGGRKMSKSIGNVIDANEFITEFGSEAVRYFLAREISPTEDGDITRENFIAAYNANLANGLGNLMSRTLTMATQYFDGTILRRGENDTPLKGKLETTQGSGAIDSFSIPYVIHNDILPKYFEHMDAFQINAGADTIWKLLGLLDGYITDYEPFKLVKTDKDKTENIIWNLLCGLYYTASMLDPIMPKTAEKILEHIGASLDEHDKPVSFKPKNVTEPMFKRK
ncbi:MAG: class I tRNA ligase family protein [bacterium]|nr:class I tRNA ligase family protein [bacterium]